MAQRSQVIDITKSYLPGDPNSFVQNLVNTDREDGEEKTLPVVPYEGYNFLPTPYGYRSYFGVDKKLAIEDLGSRAQFVLSYQLPTYKSILVALCEDGIWLGDANVLNASWQQVVSLSYDPEILREWSWCVIENILYLYRQGDPTAYKTSVGTSSYADWDYSRFLNGSTFLGMDARNSGSFAPWVSNYVNIGLNIIPHTPNFLVMAGQMGIFKAGLRLGFWDSANSVSWSSNLDLTDFIPSLENLAGNTIFGDIVGRVITIRSHAEGFIVYCTKSIVGVNEDLSGNQLWKSKKILDNIGIYYSRAVTFGQNDGEHIVYSSSGLYMIGKYNVLEGSHAIELIVPNVYDFLKESRDPVFLDTINSRYVFFNLLNSDYVFGLTSFSQGGTDPFHTRFLIGGQPWDGGTLPVLDLNCNQAATIIEQLVTFGFETKDDKTALWLPTTIETQGDTNGPLDDGGSRWASTPGFTTQDIIDSYITGTTLPAELIPTPEEHAEIAVQHLGDFPFGYVTSGIGSKSISQLMYDQQADWELFHQHQENAIELIAAATKTVVTLAVSIGAYRTLGDASNLPALPSDSVVDTVIGTYKTGQGNTEIQIDVPARILYMRKYFQEGITITRRKTTTWAYRQATSGIGGYGMTINNATFSLYSGQAYNPIPTSVTSSASAWNASTANLGVAIAALLDTNASPGPITLPSLGPAYTNRHMCSLVSADLVSGVAELQYIHDGFGITIAYRANIGPYIANPYPWYQDKTETYSYIIGTPTPASLGTADFKAIQVAMARAIINVTSDPPTVVVDSIIPIFPTGPSAITFFPPIWTGVNTLKLITSSAYPPWHTIDGTFGIKLTGTPLANAPDYATREVCSVDSPPDYPGTEFGISYSTFPFLLQVGNPVPIYPLFTGALVLDLHLKKWGKLAAAYSVLIDLEAVNLANPNIVTEDDKGMTAAIKYYDDSIRVFDDTPENSLLRYGKIGSYRLGMTQILEARAQFRFACSGTLEVDSSLDGRTIDPVRHYETTWTSATHVDGLPDISARWHVVSFSGTYDLTGLETRSVQAGRR